MPCALAARQFELCILHVQSLELREVLAATSTASALSPLPQTLVNLLCCSFVALLRPQLSALRWAAQPVGVASVSGTTK